MADFFGNLGKIISEKAEVVTRKTEEVVDVVAKKTEKTVEVQKIKSQIRVMERNNERDFTDIGKMIYDKFKKGEAVDPQFIELCEAIEEREESIDKANREVAELKGLDVCSGCKEHLEPGVAYCPKCGTKVEDSVIEIVDEDDAEDDDIVEEAEFEEETEEVEAE